LEQPLSTEINKGSGANRKSTPGAGNTLPANRLIRGAGILI